MSEAMAKLGLNYAFIYITEKCNLSCDYCYFRDRGDKTIELYKIAAFVDCLKTSKDPGEITFIISGGEPLTEPELLKGTVGLIRKSFPVNRIHVQTNGTLIDDGMVAFLSGNGIKVELGLDGREVSTMRHRKGIGKGFADMPKRIRKMKESGIEVSSNMTIHPKEARNLRENYLYLHSLGLEPIDITPAALQEWDAGRRETLKREYRKLLGGIPKGSTVYMSDDRRVTGFRMDLSLLPSGDVLPGDVYLCLPKKLRTEFAVIVVREGRVEFKGRNLAFFLRSYNSLSGGSVYKDYIITNFRIIRNLLMNHYKSDFHLRDYIEMLEWLKLENQDFLRGQYDKRQRGFC